MLTGHKIIGTIVLVRRVGIGPSFPVVSEYRHLTGDYKTPDKIVQKRLKYIEALCRDIIKQELDSYENNV